MAAGLGFKTFSTGDVLTAADTNGYLMQGVWVFADAAARTSAVTSPQEGNVSFLKDTNALEIYDGAAWVAYGSGDITGVTAGTGISGGGTAGTVTITNSMATAIDAKGDLIVGTAADTFDRLAVGGTNGHVLTVDSTTATGLKWAAAGSAGALTKITSATFSNQASVIVDTVFSSTYNNYLVYLQSFSTGANDDIQLQFRYGGSTQATDYYGSYWGIDRSNTTTTSGFNGTNQTTITTTAGSAADNAFSASLNFTNVGISSKAAYWGQGITWSNDQTTSIFAGTNNTTRTYDGFLIKSSSGNITGFYAVYGVTA